MYPPVQKNNKIKSGKLHRLIGQFVALLDCPRGEVFPDTSPVATGKSPAKAF